MQNRTLTRETWLQAAKDAGVKLEVLAAATGKSYSAVYRYSNGSRNPSDEWLGQVAAVIAAEAARRAAA